MNYRTMLLPILSTIAIMVQLVFGVEIPEEVINQTAVVVGNAIAVGLVIYGIVKNHVNRNG